MICHIDINVGGKRLSAPTDPDWPVIDSSIGEVGRVLRCEFTDSGRLRVTFDLVEEKLASRLAERRGAF